MVDRGGRPLDVESVPSALGISEGSEHPGVLPEIRRLRHLKTGTLVSANTFATTTQAEISARRLKKLVELLITPRPVVGRKLPVHCTTRCLI